MPQDMYEIATSDLVLQKLGVPAEPGQKVNLDIRIGEKTVSHEFTVSGVYRGDPVASSQMIAVSKAFQEEYAPVPEKSVLAYGGPSDENDYTGRIMADISFNTSWNLQKQADQLTARCGFPDSTDVGINWAYMSTDIDPETMLLASGLLILIILAGYLIIYNVFYINVYADIRNYGLLKTIGTTGRQIRKLVHHQANMYSLIGIPVGLLTGVILARLILPLIMADLVFSKFADHSIELSPWIFIGAAVFSWITVRLSCIRPARMAGKVTPIDAVRMTEGQEVLRSRKTKRTASVTMPRMALGNLGRNKRKAVIVVLSLSLSLVVLNVVYTFVTGFDEKAFVSQFAISDFSVTSASLESNTAGAMTVDGITDEFLEALDNQDGITEKENVYLSFVQEYTDSTWAEIMDRVVKNDKVLVSMEDTFKRSGRTFDRDDFIRQIAKERAVEGWYFGIGRICFDNLIKKEGEFDWDKFSSGKYVITSWFDPDDCEVAYFRPGEKISLANDNGEIREYEVMAVAEMPFAAGPKASSMWNNSILLPEDEYLDFIGSRHPMRTLYNVDEEHIDEAEEWIGNYCDNVEPDLTYSSRQALIREFSGTIKRYAIIGDALAGMLMLIGLLNFANTMITSIVTRKRELAVMEAVGMTRKQQVSMLRWEGSYYAMLTIIASLILSSVISATILRRIAESFWMFTWHFTLLPVAVAIPALFIIAVIIPHLSYTSIQKASVVDRLRMQE